MKDRIMTRHPDESKQGVNISRHKYDQVQAAIIEILKEEQPISFSVLTARVAAKLGGQFEGSIPWYVTTVKLDLEARGIVERLPDAGIQQLRLSVD